MDKFAKSLMICITLWACAMRAAAAVGAVDDPSTGSKTPEKSVSRNMAFETVARDLGFKVSDICSHEFTDLNRDGIRELVFSIDYSGRSFCNSIAIVSIVNFEKKQYRYHEIPAWNVVDIRSLEVRPSNVNEILLAVPQPLTDYDGTSCVATLPTLFKYDLTGIHNVNKTDSGVHYFAELYKKLDLVRKNPRVSSSAPAVIAPAVADDLSCVVIEQAKIARLLGYDSAAGYDDAVEWMLSDDEALRLKAVRVFADIGDAASLRNLNKLSSDSNLIIASKAARRAALAKDNKQTSDWGK